MNVLLVILQIIVSCSGLPILFILGHRAWQVGKSPVRLYFVAYLALTLLMLVDTALLAAYRIEELHLLMARNTATALGVLDVVIRSKLLAQLVLLFVGLALCRQHTDWRIPAWCYLVAGAWALLVLAQALGALALPAGAVVSWLSSAAPLLVWALYCLAAGQRAAKAGFILITSYGVLYSALNLGGWLAPQSLPAETGVQLALLAFLVLNTGLYRGYFLIPAAATSLDGTVTGQAPRASLAEAGLSPREQDVAARLARLASYKAIASELCISAETVKSHAKSVYRKTGCRDRLELMKRFELPL